MQVKDFLGYFSSNLEIAQNDGQIKIIDAYHENDPDYDYGVWATFESKDDLMNVAQGANCIYLIPDIYIEGEIDFLLNDDFPNEYGISNDVNAAITNELNKRGFDALADICREHGEVEAYQSLKEICDVLKGIELLKYDDIN